MADYEYHYREMNFTVYNIEKTLDVAWWKLNLDSKWTQSIWWSVFYVAAVFFGRTIMKDKEKFGLNRLLGVWSSALAIFSILGTIRVWPEMWFTLEKKGLYGSVCNVEWMDHPVNQFWTILFVVSKVVELGDTLFIVLRKQSLIFLHWYHHITVLVYTWFSFSERTSSGRWFIAMNYAVHAIMYSYFSLRAFRVKVPNSARMFITFMQLLQMIVGCYIAIFAYNTKRKGVPCGVSDININYCFLMYSSYFILFAKFFYDAYIQPSPRKPTLIKNGNINMNGHSNLNGKKAH